MRALGRTMPHKVSTSKLKEKTSITKLRTQNHEERRAGTLNTTPNPPTPGGVLRPAALVWSWPHTAPGSETSGL